ncbi:MAG: BTAD domain-containing putative transcriptional regulator [Ilumatobacter sp.]
MSVGTGGAIRRSPPMVPSERWVARERLVSQLATRFTRRLVTLVAHAGSGKTTLLALAMEANRIDPWGRDVWVALDRRDDDPELILEAIGAALGGSSSVDGIVDAVWSAAPDDVAIILDDVHVVQSPAALDVLAELVRALPGNGHLVVASRERVTLPLARLRAQFETLELEADDLAFDEDELAALVGLRGVGTPARYRHELAELPRVAALADLTIRFGAGAGAEFLWDEVLASFALPELDALRRLALVGDFDDAFAGEVIGAAGAVLELDGFTLIDRDATGRFNMHDLLRSALLEPLSASQRRELAAVTAVAAARTGDRSLAVMLYTEAGDAEQAAEVARSFIMTATLRRTYEQIKRVSHAIDRVDPDGPLARFLRAELRSGEDEVYGGADSQAAEFGAVADGARRRGDDEVEAAAIYRCHQQTLLELLPVASDRIDRLSELASRVPYAAQVLRFARASQRLRDGDSKRAWSEIIDLPDIADPQSEQVFRAGLMCLLGRFDEVVDEFGSRDASTLAPGVDEYVGYALYLSGRVSPEVAAPMFDDISEGFGRAQLAQTSVVLHTTGALISVHAGDHDSARGYVEAARAVTNKGCAPSFAINVDTAAAVLAVAVEGEDAARELLDASFGRVDLGRWPTAAHLTVLPLIYLFYPSRRERLDACDFGRPATVACDAGRALVAARERGDAAPVLALPWDEPDLLRVQVPPPLLAELAAVAAVAGGASASEVLSKIPHADRWLRRCSHGEGLAATSATALLSQRPRVPDRALRVLTLGPLMVERDGVVVDHPDLARRGRVQQLLGLLADRRSVVRSEAAELLWPELDAKAASNNLRVTLTYLNRALEPDRAPDEPPIYVTQQGETIGLHPEVVTDLDEFRLAVRNGMSHARRRAPRSAIASYEQAARLYHGTFLAGQEADWLVGPRDRARFDAIHTYLRLGELTLASGEPEEAIRWALHARDFGERHDRVERLLAGCQLATGDRAGAVATLRDLSNTLRSDGVEPEVETVRMLERLTISGD